MCPQSPDLCDRPQIWSDTDSTMRDAITHFMWGYQEHFRHALQRETERILSSLKPGLRPKVFLVGVRTNAQEQVLPACVEPELHHWAPSNALYNVLDDVPAIQEAYPESQLWHSDPIAQGRADRSLFRRAVRDAVKRRLEACSGFPEDTCLFASWPAERDAFLVITVIAVTKSVLEEAPTVTPGYVSLTAVRSYPVPCSLVEAVIREIHENVQAEIVRPDAGDGLSVLGSADQIIRQAGLRFFSGLLYRVDQDSMIGGAAAEVFDVLMRLALAPYERAEARGQLLFADKAAGVGTPVLRLAQPVPLSQARALRKLLVLTNDELALRCNCDDAFELARLDSGGTAQSIPRVVIRIAGRGKWAVSFGDQHVMVMNDGVPSLPQPAVDELRLASNLRRILRSMTKTAAAAFARIGSNLATSGHGALVVLTENATEETIRLGHESLPITPMVLTPELARKVSEIDGALLCDPEGNCHAVGVILDGTASASGDRGRGSRFNSALRYVASSQRPTAAMVVSEDGGLDLLPPLRPTLSRYELTSQLAELERLALSPSIPPDRDREADVIHWIEKHAFYLDQIECESVNRWITVCEDRFSSKSDLRMGRGQLRPDSGFDPTRDLV
jgi:hypothetical protein